MKIPEAHTAFLSFLSSLFLDASKMIMILQQGATRLSHSLTRERKARETVGEKERKRKRSDEATRGSNNSKYLATGVFAREDATGKRRPRCQAQAWRLVQ